MIAQWPGKISPGTQTDHLSAQYDVLATLCDLVGIQEVPENDGISFLPTLLGKEDQNKHEFLYWEFPSYGGQQAVRMGHWKALRQDIFQGNLDIQLYDLEEDIQETNDVADLHPDVVERADAIFRQEHQTPEVEKFRMVQLGD